MKKKCLIVTKCPRIEEKERSLIEEVKKYVDVYIVSTSELIEKQKDFHKDYFFILTIGGDGTVLKGISIASKKKKIGLVEAYIDKIGDRHVEMEYLNQSPQFPILFAFDYSTKGRLCNIKQKHFQRAREDIISLAKGEDIQNRLLTNSLIRSRFSVNGGVFSLNEIYIFSSEKGFLNRFDIYIDRKLVYKEVRCDGIIVCSDSGSSGYNFSANGPIMYPGTSSLCITIVCAADKKISSLVVPNNMEIDIKTRNSSQKIIAVIDGCLRVELAECNIKSSKEGDVHFVSYEEEKLHCDFLHSINESGEE
ncbi:NAD+ kinase [Nematocida sp. LUAm3]|nr:NAD+ kinase [Nematocida sp. LUAm3]KAI5174929.1 NAD+ kinase [Nematocida sp. LUAm2]KAI5177472.1 NAD+ kinase [Nematocida sp. LUAm1]